MDTSIPSLISNSTVPLSRFRAISQGIAILVVGIGFLVLLGWLLGIELLKSLVYGWPTMKSNTAILAILSGSLLWMKARGMKETWLSLTMAFVILLTSTLTLGEYIFRVDIGIDQLFFKDLSTEAIHPGRMSFFTALSFILIVFAFFSLNRSSKSQPKEYFLLPVFFLTMLALIGYLYGVSSLYKFGDYASIAASTAGSLLFLSMGILFAEPDRGLVRVVWANTDGGYFLRRFLPVIFIFPAVLGWFRLMGQRLGLYDTAFGLAIMVTTLTTFLAFIVWRHANQITEVQKHRQQAEFARIENENKFELLFNKSAVPAAVLKLPEFAIIDANEAMEKLVGLTKNEMYGKTTLELGLNNISKRQKILQKFENQKALIGDEIKITIKSGEQREVLIHANSLVVNTAPHVILTMQDISEQKRAERELIQLNEELEEKIKERTKELAQANQQLHQLSILDELTGLYNRRGFLLLAEKQLLIARRSKRNLLLFYADMDGLKQINDQQGHGAGDQALITVAKSLEKTFRTSDIKARLGGDEFIVMAIEAKEPDIPTVLRRLEASLNEHALSMSIGVISIDPRKKVDLGELITNADKAMYKVKLQKPSHRI